MSFFPFFFFQMAPECMWPESLQNREINNQKALGDNVRERATCPGHFPASTQTDGPPGWAGLRGDEWDSTALNTVA